MQRAQVQLSVRLVLLIAAFCTVFLLIGGPADAVSPAPPAVEYVVKSGDSLWSIAASHVGEGADVRRLVRDIRDLSNAGSTIFPGQILLIPAA